MDIVAGPINDSLFPNLFTMRRLLWLAASSFLLKADDSNNMFLCLANLKVETANLFLKRSDVIYHTNDKKNPPPEIASFN